MPALTISAVDNTTDQITITAHGLSTGDGFLAIDAAPGTYPAPLAAVTDYWAIRVDANTIKLATSSANALANVPINLTTNGSGTLFLLQGLPYRVPGIAAAGAQIKSATDNATWLSFVALWNLLTGQAQAIWTTVTLAVAFVANALITAAAGLLVPTGQNITLAGTADLKHGQRQLALAPIGVYSASMSYDTTNFWAINSAAAIALIPIPLKEGDRILGYTATRFGSASAFSNLFAIYKTTAAGPQGANANFNLTASSPNTAAWTTSVLTAGTPYTIAAGDQLYFGWSPSATVTRWGGVTINYDRP